MSLQKQKIGSLGNLADKPPQAGSSSVSAGGSKSALSSGGGGGGGGFGVIPGSSTTQLKSSMGSMSGGLNNNNNNSLHSKKQSGTGFNDTASIISNSRSNIYNSKSRIGGSMTNLSSRMGGGSMIGLNFDNESVLSFATGKRKSKDGASLFNLKEKEPVVMGLVKPRFYKKEESEVFCMRFSLDSDYLCAGLGNGSIQVYSTKTNGIACTLAFPNTNSNDNTKYPVTGIAFRPNRRDFKNQNVLVASYADGKLIHWHFTTGNRLSVIEDVGGDLNCVQYSPDGTMFAAAGSKPYIHVYDAFTHKIKYTLQNGDNHNTAGHSNKIFSIKFHPKNPNHMISAGWDNTIQFWDLKLQKSTLSVFEPRVFGDAIDFNATGDLIVVGSHRKFDSLQIYSWPQGKLMETIPWTIIDNNTDRNCSLYSTHFSHSGIITPGNRPATNNEAEANNYIVAGGGCPTANEVRIFSNVPGGTHRCVGMISGAPSMFYTTSVSQNDRLIACGGLGKTVYCYDIDPNLYSEFPY